MTTTLQTIDYRDHVRVIRWPDGVESIDAVAWPEFYTRQGCTLRRPTPTELEGFVAHVAFVQAEMARTHDTGGF